MSETEKKGITVKIDADLHTQVRQYIEANGMTMAEFVSKALDDELHPILWGIFTIHMWENLPEKQQSVCKEVKKHQSLIIFMTFYY